MNTALTSWFNENQANNNQYDLNKNQCYVNANCRNSLLDYLQLLNANTSQAGCGIASCNNGQSRTVICLFDVPYARPNAPFVLGTPCTDAQNTCVAAYGDAAPQCYNGLCRATLSNVAVPPKTTADNSATSASSNASGGGGKSGLDGGAIAGIVIGVLVGVVVLCAAVWYYLYRVKRKAPGSHFPRQIDTHETGTEMSPI